MKYTLYKVRKTKSQIKGYWIDKGKLYKDNIKLVSHKDYEALNQGIQALFNKGEKAVFYTLTNKGFCVDTQGKLTVYNKRLRLHRHKLSASEVKRLLKHFGGLTCYKLQDKYIIEVFYN